MPDIPGEAPESLKKSGVLPGTFGWLTKKFKRNPKILKLQGDPGASFYPSAVILARCDGCGVVPGHFRAVTNNANEGLSEREPYAAGLGIVVYRDYNSRQPNTFACTKCGGIEPLVIPDEDPNLPLPTPVQPSNVVQLRNGDFVALPSRKYGGGRQRAALLDLPGSVLVEMKIKYERGASLRDLADFANKSVPGCRANKTNVDVLVKNKGWMKGSKTDFHEGCGGAWVLQSDTATSRSYACNRCSADRVVAKKAPN